MAGRQAGCLGRTGHLYDCTVIFGLVVPRGRRCSRNGGVTQDGQILQPSSWTHFLCNSGQVSWSTLWGRWRVVTWSGEMSVRVFRRRPRSSISFCINGFQLSCSVLTLYTSLFTKMVAHKKKIQTNKKQYKNTLTTHYVQIMIMLSFVAARQFFSWRAAGVVFTPFSTVFHIFFLKIPW